MSAHALPLPDAGHGLAHEAVLYDGPPEFDVLVGGAVRTAIAHDLPVFAVVPPERLAILREVAGPPRPAVRLLDMTELGRNPARTMSAAQEFFAGHPGRRCLFVGEPLAPGRTPGEVAEVRINEAVVDVAFADAPLTVLCPFDTSRLGAGALALAETAHACVTRAGQRTTKIEHDARAALAEAMAAPLPPAPDGAVTMPIGDSLRDVRELVRRSSEPLLGAPRALDLVLAANELAANTLRHSASSGVVRVWAEDGAVVCEVHDGGRLADLTVGRRMPDLEQESGRGLWMATQLCDLTQIRSSAEGTTVRLTMRAGAGR